MMALTQEAKNKLKTRLVENAEFKNAVSESSLQIDFFNADIFAVALALLRRRFARRRRPLPLAFASGRRHSANGFLLILRQFLMDKRTMG